MSHMQYRGGSHHYLVYSSGWVVNFLAIRLNRYDTLVVLHLVSSRFNPEPFEAPQSYRKMPPSPRISELAATIQNCTAEIEEFMSMHNVPQATFDIDSPLTVDLPPSLSNAREEALDALDQLHALLLGPLLYFMRLTSPTVRTFYSMTSCTVLIRF